MCVSKPPQVLTAVALLCGGLVAQPSHGQDSNTIAIIGATVIPMDRERVLLDHTVLIVDHRIAVVGPRSEVRVPDDATVIEGSGRFLMPGLADMHVHLRNAEDMPVYIANGVTTVLDMGGPATRLQWRSQTASGEVLGPRMFVSRFINGRGPGGGASGVGDVEGARDIVRESVRQGYDYLKVYNALSTPQFDAIIEEAALGDIAVIGHGVRDPGLEHILESGMRMVAHAEEYIYTFFRGCTDTSRMDEAIALTQRTGAYLLPNLSAYEIIALQWGKPPVVDSLLAGPEHRYLHPSFRSSWQGGRYTARSGGLRQCVVFLRTLTKAFADAGIPLLLGTDSPGIPGMYPGYSIHNDLRNMVESGLTPFQALSAGTRVAGEFARATVSGVDDFGVIRIGARADLVLLASNPLADVANVRRPLGVVVNGRWWSAVALQDQLDALAARFGLTGL